ncbi:MAG: L,D-transpeptidase family protein [Sphingomicrobium sp.]
MKTRLAIALALSSAFALTVPASPAAGSYETPDAKAAASDAAALARSDMFEAFGDKQLKPGQYVWRDVPADAGPQRVVISLSDQLAFLYRGDMLVAVSTISSGNPDKPTPTGIFPILEKQTMYHSRKYDNAPMPFMQRIDNYGVALHAGYNPGVPASHGCVRLPPKFAAKLFTETEVGTPVIIGS